MSCTKEVNKLEQSCLPVDDPCQGFPGFRNYMDQRVVVRILLACCGRDRIQEKAHFPKTPYMAPPVPVQGPVVEITDLNMEMTVFSSVLQLILIISKFKMIWIVVQHFL